MPDTRTTDQLLREYLAGKPHESIEFIRDEVTRLHARLTDELSAIRHELLEHERRDEERFRKLEQSPSERPPTMRDLGKLVTDTGSWDITKIDQAIAAREAAAALARQKAIVSAGGKVAIALVVAILIFAGGSFWRDLYGPRPSSTTSITTIAPGQAQR